MKSKSARFSSFLNSTNMVNYKDNKIIISNFNESVRLYKKFLSSYDGGDEFLASKFIMNAATTIYHACEWSLKNYLERNYRESERKGLISINDRVKYVDNLSRKSTRLSDLIDEMNRIAKPTAYECNIKYSDILRYSNAVNNNTKHDAKIPSPVEYKLVLGEVRKIITSYVQKDALLDFLDESMYGIENAWYELLEECNNFSDDYSYILVTGPMSENINKSAIFNIHWDLVIDMDPFTDLTGLANLYRKNIGANPWLRRLTSIDSKRNFTYSNLTYWIFGNGISDEPESIVVPKMWKSKYWRQLSDLLSNFHNTYTKQAKVIFYPFGDERNLESIVELFNVIYTNGDDVDFYVLSPESEYSRIDVDNFHKTGLSLSSFCDNLHIYAADNINHIFNQKKAMPSSGGKKVEIESGFYMELTDSFEILYDGIEYDDEEIADRISREAFYKGLVPISWYGLKEHFDIERRSQKTFINLILDDLSERGRLLKKISYEAGTGGTTFMRRLAWEIKERYPTLIIKRINEQSAKNIQKIYDLAFLPVVLFADGNSIEYVDIQKLHAELKTMGFAFIICYMDRKLHSTPLNGGGLYGPLTRLNINEAKDMKSKLLPYCINENSKSELERICNSSLDDDERSPFIMSMYTFDKDFHGIKPYINSFIRNMNDHTKKLIFALALSDYSNTSIDKQYFIDLFNDNNIEAFLMNEGYGFKELAKSEYINGKQYIKIKYHLFGDEILKQISGGDESTRIIFINLVDYILEFIENSRQNEFIFNKDTVELLRTLFVTRIEDADSSKPVFSPLIAKLNEENKEYISAYSTSKDAIARIFGKLVEVYPEEPHFTAHLARYYFYIDKDYPKGFSNIDKAIELSELVTGTTDPRLYHMKAMGYSSRIVNTYIKEIQKELRDGNMEIINELISSILDDAENAFVLFDKVRKNNIGIAGHVSDILLCIHISNMGRSLLDSNSISIEITKETNDWIVKFIDRAALLFDECKKIAIETDDEDIREIEVLLSQLTSDLEESISIWENYLKTAKGEKLINARRMLARAYQKSITLTKKGYNQDYIQRILKLMEENIEEEPNQPGNIRIWFEAIRKLDTDNQDALMMDAVIKLNRWIALTDSVEAHYYRFVIKFIQSVNGSISSRSDLPKLLRELKNKSSKLYNRTSIIEWLGSTGYGLDMLIPNIRNKKNAISEDEMAQKMYFLTGRISNNYVNESHAYLSYEGVEVYFNPSSTKGEVDKTKINQRVRFGVGFSYDGPRAFNSSIKLLTTDILEELALTKNSDELHDGQYVKCEVLNNSKPYFINVRIIGYEEKGSIHVSDLIPPYSSNFRPSIGQILDAKTLKKKFDNSRQIMIWGLTMNLDEKTSINEDIKMKLEMLDFKVSE